MPEQETFRLSEHIGIITEVLESGGEFTLFPRGTSMLPLIVQGRDSVTLVKSDVYSVGDIAFYRRADGAFVLHRIVGKKDGTFIMCGDNQLEREFGVFPEQVIGKAVRITRGGRKIGAENIAYRLYKILWKSFLIRRVFFRLRGTFYAKKRLG